MHEPEDNGDLEEPDGDLQEPILRAHRREHRLHDVNRQHGAERYAPRARAQEINRALQAGQAHPQYYQYHWETVGDRWMWLRPNNFNRRRARCIACNRGLTATITVVRNHENSNRHVNQMARRRGHIPVDRQVLLNEDAFYDKVAEDKILLVTWLTDEGIADRKIDTLVPLIKRLARHPGPLQEMKLSRTDVPKIRNRIIAHEHQQDLARRLSGTKFGTLFDESTSISHDKHGCLLIRFADHRTYKVRTVLWDLIQIYRDDEQHDNATAQALYRLMMDSLFTREPAGRQHRLQERNYLSSTTDGPNVMIGPDNSVSQRLRLNFPGITTVVCPCHGTHLCDLHSIDQFPQIVPIMHGIYNWYCSAGRLHALKQNQILMNMDMHRILRHVTSRWLTELKCLLRIEEQRDAILATFAQYQGNEQAQNLTAELERASNQVFIAFLTFILEVPEDCNGWLQTEEVILPEVYERISTDFKDILLCYMNEEYVEDTDPLFINVNNVEEFLDFADMRIGLTARERVTQIEDGNEHEEVLTMIREYLIRLATEWQERLVTPWARYQCTEALLMENAMSDVFHQEFPNIIHQLVMEFPRAVPHDVNEEVLQEQWTLLLENERELQVPADARIDYFWFVIRGIDNGHGEHPYRQLADFVLNVLSIAHSNAQPERIWSLEKYIRNKFRNKLSVTSMKAIIYVKECLKLQGCANKVHKFRPTEVMIRRVRNRDYHNNANGELADELAELSDNEEDDNEA